MTRAQQEMPLWDRRKGRARARQARRQLLAETLPALEGLPVVDSYRAGIFEVRIAKKRGGLLYAPLLTGDAVKLAPLAATALQSMVAEEWTPPTSPCDFGDLLHQVRAEAAAVLAASAGPLAYELAGLVAIEFVGLPSLQPFIEDEQVDEVYLDGSRSRFYLDHRKHGRCDSSFGPNPGELVALQTHLEMFSGEAPTLAAPCIKAEMKLGDMRMRVGVDLPPLAVAGPSIHIRKVGATPFTLARLVKCGTLGTDEAAFLGASMIAPINITIIGPSGSGKTTLLNALDMAAPAYFRRIYVEDAVETLDLTAYGFHQTKLRVSPIESERGGSEKGLEVLKSLHKTPDLLILGEVQNEAHSRALFQALSSGIKGLQTYHASSPEQALRRWTSLHGVSKVQLADLGVIVTMARPDLSSSKRFVVRISEVRRGTDEVVDIIRTSPPFVDHLWATDIPHTNVSKDADALRGSGWFEAEYRACRRRLCEAVRLDVEDVGAFLDAYWARDEGEMRVAELGR